mmetsp:Transcript_50430/g.159645  ORF Transcript_50430/g.159645 Transcript_50430/m.159645 type:complete len:276 (+) Transcript_50430:50-877(+)
MLSLTSAPLSLAPTAVMGRASAPKMSFADEFTFDSKPWSSSEIKDKAGLEALAKKLNPTVGLWDPLGIAETSPETIGWFRHAEIKHGRVAMAAFVGYIVQSNGICWPWALTGGPNGVMHSDILAAGGPADQWDALPTASKLQILLFVGGLELWSENSYVLGLSGEKHYMRGGKPGFFPSIKKGGIPHPVPFDLFDPFGLSKNASPEKKAKGLLAEINNGRLAMLGIMAFVSESKVPGSVPALAGKIAPYSGEVMAPFAASDNLPFVADMLKSPLF